LREEFDIQLLVHTSHIKWINSNENLETHANTLFLLFAGPKSTHNNKKIEELVCCQQAQLGRPPFFELCLPPCPLFFSLWASMSFAFHLYLDGICSVVGKA
jgi:hypothetical protein